MRIDHADSGVSKARGSRTQSEGPQRETPGSGEEAMKTTVLPYTSMAFLRAREQVISLSLMPPTSTAAYVWRRVFLKGGFKQGR